MPNTIVKNLVAELSSNPGEGPFGVAGGIAGRQTFQGAGFANNDTPGYFAISQDKTQYEWGVGTLTIGTSNTIARTIIGGNSEGTSSPINFTGLVTVYNQIPSGYIVYRDLTGNYVDGLGNRILPAGMIILWSGSIASIPTGWALCNGTNGTPNLEDKFVIGAGGAQAVGATGGSATGSANTASAGAHNHGGADVISGPFGMSGSADVQGTHAHGAATGSWTLTSSDTPSHNHGMGTQVVTVQSGETGIVIPFTATFNGAYIDSYGSGGGHGHGISSDGAHSHNISVSNSPAHQHAISVDGAHTHTVTVATMPPFYALAYIMKL